MIEDCPSHTALRAAFRRAAHQVLDDPRVFDDPLSLRILGFDDPLALQSSPKWPTESPMSRVLRASLAARSRYCEDELHLAVRRGVSQYVVLGAGLDTFACRNPYPAPLLRVFEVDRSDTQAWKRSRLQDEGIAIPETLTFVPINFERETLRDCLQREGFDTRKPTFFSWLGVTMYLTESAITRTIEVVASLPKGSGIVFDYMIPRTMLDPIALRAFEALAGRVASLGEPFQTFFAPPSLKNDLLGMGFSEVEDLDPEEMNVRYFQGRTDGLRMGSLAHVIHAQV